MRRNRTYAALLVAMLLPLSGCKGEEEVLAAEAEPYVAVIVELRRSATRHGDRGAFEAEKQRILASAGVTEEQLRAYIQSQISDLDQVAAFWEAVNERLTVEPAR